MTRARLLVVDDKPNFLALFRRIVPPDFDLECAADATQALALAKACPFDVVVTDVRLPGADGLTLLREIKRLAPSTEVILMTAFGAIPAAVEAMRHGAFDYLTKPFDPHEALAVIERALERRSRQAERRDTVETAAEPRDAAETPPSEPPPDLRYREMIALTRDRTTHDYLITLLRAADGNVTQAAERAGLERESVHRLMKRYGIRAEDFRKK